MCRYVAGGRVALFVVVLVLGRIQSNWARSVDEDVATAAVRCPGGVPQPEVACSWIPGGDVTRTGRWRGRRSEEMDPRNWFLRRSPVLVSCRSL